LDGGVREAGPARVSGTGTPDPGGGQVERVIAGFHEIVSKGLGPASRLFQGTSEAAPQTVE